MSNEYEVVPKEEVPNKFNEIPSDWLKSYVGTNYVFLRPVSLPVQDGDLKSAWEDGWESAFYAVKQGWQACNIGHDVPQTLLNNFLSKQPTPTVTTQGEGNSVCLRFAEWCSWNYQRVMNHQDQWLPTFGEMPNRSLHTSELWKVFITGNTYAEALTASLPAAGGAGEDASIADNPKYLQGFNDGVDWHASKAGGQSAGVWVKAYYKEGKTVGLPPKGKEQILIRYDDNRELGDWVLIEELLENGWLNVEWLDESLQPATTGEAIAFDRLAYRYADDDGNFPLSRYQPLFDKLYEITAKAFLQDEMFEIIDVVRKMDGIALTPSPNATERQEGENQ